MTRMSGIQRVMSQRGYDVSDSNSIRPYLWKVLEMLHLSMGHQLGDTAALEDVVLLRLATNLDEAVKRFRGISRIVVDSENLCDLMYPGTVHLKWDAFP